MKKIAVVAVMVVCVSLMIAYALNKKPSEIREYPEKVEDEGDGSFVSVYDGVTHRFIMDLPEKTEVAPLVLMLPGYGNSGETMRRDTNFQESANPRGYAVVYVNGAADPRIPSSSYGWNWQMDPEGNRDVDFIVALTNYLQDNYSFDRDRTFVVGFSNGAFMAHCLAVEAGDKFRSVVSVCGSMPRNIWDNRKETNDTGIFQMTGEKDDVVPKNSDGTAGFTDTPPIEDVMDYWVSSNGLELYTTESVGDGSKLYKYGKEGQSKEVWHLFEKGGTHSWPQERHYGYDISAYILDFFDL